MVLRLRYLWMKTLTRTLVLASLCASGLAWAQAPTGPTATLTVNARLVVLDVVVTDKKGNPVTDLKREDFMVTEDGKPQVIKSFEAPGTHALPAETMAGDPLTEVFDPAKPANFGQSPVSILVFDQLNTHFSDANFARKSLEDYLKKQPAVLKLPTTLLTVNEKGFKMLQQFTRDRATLLAALAKAPIEYPWKLEVNGKAEHGPIERLQATLQALEQIASTYSRIRGRKNLIWVGGGFPSIDPNTLASKDELEVQDTIKHVTNVMLDARLTLYAVDPTSTAAGMTEIVDFQQMAAAELGAELSVGNDPVDEGGDFDSLGKLTGGRVMRGMNNVADQIAISVDYGAQFYTLGYTPQSASDEAQQFRKIRVTTTRPGLVVTTRTGYYVGHPSKEGLNQAISYDLSAAAESTVPLNALHVSVDADTSVAVLNDAWVVRVGAPELTWTYTDSGEAKASVAIIAVSLDHKGKMLGHVLRGMIATARPGVNLHDEAKTAHFAFTAKPAPKAAKLRFVVRDGETGRMGSFDVTLKP